MLWIQGCLVIGLRSLVAVVMTRKIYLVIIMILSYLDQVIFVKEKDCSQIELKHG